MSARSSSDQYSVDCAQLSLVIQDKKRQVFEVWQDKASETTGKFSFKSDEQGGLLAVLKNDSPNTGEQT